jgi:TolB-like protein/DNA-binding winged helix-turn-helix (wHTH) protein/Tfp pilus assembly protein PilF
VDSLKAFKVGEWLVEPALDRISYDSVARSVRPQVMELLVYLAERPGQVVSTDELLSNLWDGRVVTEGSVYNCIGELRGVLVGGGIDGTAIETIPRKGYRLIATVTAHDAMKPMPASRRRPIAAILAVAFVVIAATSIWLQNRDSEPLEIRSLAVLPLENHSPDPTRDAYFTDGMTEALIARLSRISGLKVISRTSSMQLKKSDMTIPEIAKALSVDGVIEGSVMTADREVRITLQLIDGKSDTHLWTNSYVRSFDDVLDLQDEIANAIANELRRHVADSRGTPLQASLLTPRPVTDSAEAYRAYLKGRFSFNRFGAENFQAALDYYEEATTIDPTFALAYASMAEACMQPMVIHSGIRSLVECERDARRAVALDENLAEAHAIHGFLEMLNWRWAESDRSFRRSIELDPNSVMARQWYSLTLRATNRLDKSLQEIRRAEQLDPLNLFVKTMVGWPLYNQGEYEQALAQWDDVIDMDDGFMLAHYNQGLAYMMMQRPDDVFAAARRVEQLAGQDALEARLLNASGHAIAGDNDKATEILDSVERDAGQFMAAWIASIHLMMGNEEVALARLEQGAEQRAVDMIAITEPQFNAIRHHPRFRAVSQKMGLPDPGADPAI